MMEKFKELNNDLPINILSRLPAKDLLGLKHVSKGWHCLISGRSFIKDQVKTPEPVSGFLFQERYHYCKEDISENSYIPIGKGPSKVKHTIFDFLPEAVTILAVSNGLVCCRSCMPCPYPTIYVCNPLNKEWVVVKWTNPGERNCIALAFDPFQDPVDTCTNFKLVRLHYVELENDDFCFLFEIFSSRTREWKMSEEMCRSDASLSDRRGIFVGGVIHWLVEENYVLTFNVEKEVSWLLSAPFPTILFNNPRTCIGESNGKMCYIVLSEDGLQVWVLDDYYECKWSLHFSTTLQEMEMENPDIFFNVAERVTNPVSKILPWIDPLAFRDGVLLMRMSMSIFLYRVEARKAEELCPLSDLGENSIHSPLALPYTMTLVPFI